MKRLLLFLLGVLVSMGIKAEDFTGGSITISGTTATVNVTQQGAFNTWLSTTENANKLSGVTKVVFSSSSTINDGDINALAGVSTLKEINATGCKLINTGIKIENLGIEVLTLNKVSAESNNWGEHGKNVIIQNCPNLQTLNLQNIRIVWPNGNGELLTVTNNVSLKTIDLSGAYLSVMYNTNPNLDFSNNSNLSSLILARVDMIANTLSNTTISILGDTNLKGIILPVGILKRNLIYTDEDNTGLNVPLHYIATVEKDANSKYNIEVDLMDGGGYFKEFADAISTSGESNFDKIVITGELNAQDFRDMETTALPVPKIDLSGRELADDDAATAEHYRFSSSNTVTTNVLLPEGWPIVSSDFEPCQSLHSVMSATRIESEEETTKYTVDAYVKTPGTLYETVAMAETSKYPGFERMKVEGIKIAGSLLPNDIASTISGTPFDENGHLVWEKADGNPVWEEDTDGSFSFNGKYGTTVFPLAFDNAQNIKSIDLEKAYFKTNSDMALAKLIQLAPVTEVKLPVSVDQTEIPAYCFYNMQNVKELCIPYNYKEIGERAFWNTGITHIYTTVPKDYPNYDDARVDHGENTITFSPKLERIKSSKDGVSTFSGGGMNSITDIYILAETAPECEAYAFQASLTYGYGGFINEHPIQRSCYYNSNQAFAMLHFPKACRTNGQAQNYTDITRVYTLYDETGANDAYGNTIMWPTQEEFKKSYDQAKQGILWDGSTTYTKEDYQGWHEFVLADYFNVINYDPQEYFDTFEERDWYTLCVPYNLTKSQLLTTLGVRSIDGKTKTVNNMDGTKTTVSEDLYPDVRMLTHVSRSVSEGKVTFHLSENIVEKNQEVVITNEGKDYSYGDFTGDSSDPIVIKGGYPYLIRPYIPVTDEITSIGKYVVAVMADMHETATARQDGTGDNYTKGYTISGTTEGSSIYVPYEKYYIHARNADTSKDNQVEYVYKDNDKTEACLYHFIGTYMLQDIEPYSYFLGKKTDGTHHFFWAEYEKDDEKEKWNEYSAVIVGLSSVIYTIPPSLNPDDAANYQMKVTNGNDLELLDSEKPAGGSGTKTLTYVFDDSSKATGIKGVTVVKDNVTVGAGKIYNINGQYVGASTSDLPKGVYIKEGKKFVVK